ERLGCGARETAMVGDSTASDITGGRSAGMFTIWLNPEKDAITPTSVDLEVKDLAELQTLWRQARTAAVGGEDRVR
ncbi:MAG TPA: HAD hydrolase-like protein, partial [Isosphaeraceae bacterium]|nr:HAD hydrolase-like protein [Isosphaeraceae bacterium]